MLIADSLTIATGWIAASPFVVGAGPSVTETVTGRAHALSPAEQRLLASCATSRPLTSLDAGDRALAQGLVDRLLLLDDRSLAGIGALTMSELDLEVAGSCNAECIFCPRDELRHGRGVGVMHVETFEAVLARFAPFLRFVGFAGIGEPTLNRHLPRFVAALTARRIETALVTNGSLLTDELVDELLAAGVGSVQVSFNGLDRASYEEHMVGLDFEATRARVERLLLRSKGALPIYVSAVETSRNQRELVGFVEYWRARGAEAGVVRCHSRGGTIVELTPRRPAPPSDVTPRCGLFNTRSFVSWDGRVLACCHDVDGETALGRVQDDETATIIARKLEVMRRREWYKVCGGCDEPARLATVTPERVRARPR